jgi:DNA polymerase-1
MDDRWRPDVVLIDGRHLLFRAADAHSTLEAATDDGDSIPTGGVYGMLTVLVKLRRRYGGRYIIAWEGSGNFRYKLFPDYKRREPPTEAVKQFKSDLIRQERIVRRILGLLGVRQYEAVGGEADDVLGTIADRAEQAGLKVAIFTGDSDLHQLVSDSVVVIRPEKRREVVYDLDAVKERWGVASKDLPLLKALMGDSSDSIPGIPGVGEKTAAKMIQEYGSLSEIVAAAKNKDAWAFSERYRNLVQTHASDAMLYLRLTTIDRNMKLKEDPVKVDPLGARRAMKELKFRRMLEAGNFKDLRAMAG